MVTSLVLRLLTFNLDLLKVNLLLCLCGVIAVYTCYEPSSNTLLLLLVFDNLDIALCICLEHAGLEHVMEELVVMVTLCDLSLHLLHFCVHLVDLVKLVRDLILSISFKSLGSLDLFLVTSSLGSHLEEVVGVTLHC